MTPPLALVNFRGVKRGVRREPLGIDDGRDNRDELTRFEQRALIKRFGGGTLRNDKPIVVEGLRVRGLVVSERFSHTTQCQIGHILSITGRRESAMARIHPLRPTLAPPAAKILHAAREAFQPRPKCHMRGHGFLLRLGLSSPLLSSKSTAASGELLGDRDGAP
jgi:hypothetical protein